MENEKTIEGNKLIAEFYMVIETNMGKVCYIPIDTNSYPNIPIKRYKEDELLFHTSWDWLMPVVVKANDLNAKIQRGLPDRKSVNDATGWSSWSNRYIHLSTDIEHVWEKTIQFIQWYNTQSKK